MKKPNIKDLKALLIVLVIIFIGYQTLHAKPLQKTEAPNALYTSLPEAENREVPPEEKYYYLLKTDYDFKNYITSFSVSCNNPGNLRFHRQPNGFNCGSFAGWNNITEGFRALLKQLELDQSRNLTLRQFIYNYSPPHENRTEYLLDNLEEWTGIKEYENIAQLDTIKFAQAITRQEHGIKY